MVMRCCWVVTSAGSRAPHQGGCEAEGYGAAGRASVRLHDTRYVRSRVRIVSRLRGRSLDCAGGRLRGWRREVGGAVCYSLQYAVDSQ